MNWTTSLLIFAASLVPSALLVFCLYRLTKRKTDFQFTCEACGDQFDADPNCVVEEGASLGCPCCDFGMSEEELDDLIAKGEILTPEALDEMSDSELTEIGLTPAERDRLLNGEEIVTGGTILCPKCIEKEFAE